MDTKKQIEEYIASQPQLKRADIEALHNRILNLLPGARLWFLDGTDESGKVVSNPSIGYGLQTITYANGKTREFYQIGISGNTTGLSVYIMGIKDKTYLARIYGQRLGKASVTGYCIKFKKLKDIEVAILESAILDGVGLTA